MGARDGADETLLKAASDCAPDRVFSARDFERVRRLIYERAGISLNDSKRSMVYSRLARRLRSRNIDSFAAYLDRLEHDAGFGASEEQQFVNALTTNLTAFFREPHHFPLVAEHVAASGAVRVWCAAASTGEEAYSIAMTLLEAQGLHCESRIVASDIDTDVLATAAAGMYSVEAAKQCGAERLKRFFMRGKGSKEGMARVRPEVAALVDFIQVNLLDEDFPAQPEFVEGFDVVFCRNVMIYFDKATQREVLRRIARVMRPGALLFVGHSENFIDCRDWFELRGKTVYERI